MDFRDVKAFYKHDEKKLLFQSERKDGHYFFFYHPESHIKYCAEDVFCDDDWIILPYIGIDDIDGEKIYLDDVIDVYDVGWIGRVTYGRASYYLVGKPGGLSAYPSWEGCRRLGNINENPELESKLGVLR